MAIGSFTIAQAYAFERLSENERRMLQTLAHFLKHESDRRIREGFFLSFTVCAAIVDFPIPDDEGEQGKLLTYLASLPR
jgi:hypothetical protein